MCGGSGENQRFGACAIVANLFAEMYPATPAIKAPLAGVFLCGGSGENQRFGACAIVANLFAEMYPTRPNCHCKTIEIPTITATAECPIEKFMKYVFVPSIKDDKKRLFELWGYDIMDSEYLKKEVERQAKTAYAVGDYELGLLNQYGQRINVIITLKRKDKNEYVTFRSGWMVYPNGKIVLTTPFGGK